MLHAFPGDWFPPGGSSLALAIVYEDCDTHHQATRLYEFLLRKLNEDAHVTAAWWRTSLVPDPKLSRAAARSIAEADLIIIAVHEEHEPSELIKSWMHSWPMASRRSVKLISMLLGVGDDPGQPGDWDACLRSLAEEKGLCYVPGSPEALNLSEASEGGEDGSIEPYAHWGLNE